MNSKIEEKLLKFNKNAQTNKPEENITSSQGSFYKKIHKLNEQKATTLIISQFQNTQNTQNESLTNSNKAAGFTDKLKNANQPNLLSSKKPEIQGNKNSFKATTSDNQQNTNEPVNYKKNDIVLTSKTGLNIDEKDNNKDKNKNNDIDLNKGSLVNNRIANLESQYVSSKLSSIKLTENSNEKQISNHQPVVNAEEIKNKLITKMMTKKKVEKKFKDEEEGEKDQPKSGTSNLFAKQILKEIIPNKEDYVQTQSTNNPQTQELGKLTETNQEKLNKSNPEKTKNEKGTESNKTKESTEQEMPKEKKSKEKFSLINCMKEQIQKKVNSELKNAESERSEGIFTFKQNTSSNYVLDLGNSNDGGNFVKKASLSLQNDEVENQKRKSTMISRLKAGKSAIFLKTVKQEIGKIESVEKIKDSDDISTKISSNSTSNPKTSNISNLSNLFEKKMIMFGSSQPIFWTNENNKLKKGISGFIGGDDAQIILEEDENQHDHEVFIGFSKKEIINEIKEEEKLIRESLFFQPKVKVVEELLLNKPTANLQKAKKKKKEIVLK